MPSSPSTYVGPSELFRLLWGGLILRGKTYAEVRDAGESTRLCLAVAVLAGAAFGLRLAAYGGLSPALLAVDRILIVLGQILLESAVIWGIGVALLRRSLRFGAALRPLALARAPQVAYAVLALLQVPPQWDFVVAVWLLVAFALAIRTALASGWLLAWSIVAVQFLVGEMLTRTGTLFPAPGA
jgi:hypothetical protein